MNGLIHGSATLLRMLLDPRQRGQIDWGEAASILNPGTWQAADWSLLVGIAVAVGLVLWSRQEADAAEVIEEEGQRTDLAEEKEAALEALRHLELEKDKLSPEEYAEQRKELVDRGASALRALDEAPQTEPAPATDIDELEAELRARREAVGATAFDEAVGRVVPGGLQRGTFAAEWRGAFYALATVALGVAMYQFAGQGSRARIGEESMTGVDMNPPQAPRQQPSSMEASLKAEQERLEALLDENPEDIEALNDLTQIGLSGGDLGLAQSSNQKVLELEPTNKEARVFRAVLSALVGMPDRGLAYLDELLAEDPEFGMALTYKGLIAAEAGKWEIAADALEKAIEVQGEHPALRGALERARSQLGEGTESTGAAVLAAGTATLTDDQAAIVADAQVVFVSVADPASPRPPLAAVKLKPGFPLNFQVTESDVIPMARGRGLPDEVLVTVRVDLDGDAFSRDPSEPAATTTVARGTEGIELALE